jgi:hypothetical protein
MAEILREESLIKNWMHCALGTRQRAGDIPANAPKTKYTVRI